MTLGRKKALDQYGSVATGAEAGFASPHRLVQMLMEGVLDKIATAKGQIDRKDYAGKSRHISWAISIIGGLRSSLDMETGGEIATNLDDLYGYMTRCLIDANSENSVQKLDEVSGLMVDIKSAWDSMPDEIRNPSAAS